MSAAITQADGVIATYTDASDRALDLLNELVADLSANKGATVAQALASRLQDALVDAFNAAGAAMNTLEHLGMPPPATSASKADTPPAWQRDVLAQAVRHLAINWHRQRAPLDFAVADHKLHGGRYRAALACDPITAQLSLHVYYAGSGAFVCASSPVSLAQIDPANWNRTLRLSVPY